MDGEGLSCILIHHDTALWQLKLKFNKPCLYTYFLLKIYVAILVATKTYLTTVARPRQEIPPWSSHQHWTYPLLTTFYSPLPLFRLSKGHPFNFLSRIPFYLCTEIIVDQSSSKIFYLMSGDWLGKKRLSGGGWWGAFLIDARRSFKMTAIKSIEILYNISNIYCLICVWISYLYLENERF